MKKILLFIIGMLCFVGVVNADLGNYRGKIVSTSVILGDSFQYEVNFTGPNYINEKIYYDGEFLEYSDFYIKCADSVECHYDEATTCSVEKIRDGELLLKCDESEDFGYYIPVLIFKAEKEGKASLKIGGEYADYVTIVKTVNNKEDVIEENKNEITDSISSKEVSETSKVELLKEPFVIGIISGFSIVVIVLSVMLSKKTKELKNIKIVN